MILIRLALLPFRVAFGATGLSFRLGYRTGNLLGYRRMFVLGVGVGVGLLIAPVPGRELRARIRAKIEGEPPAAPGVASAGVEPAQSAGVDVRETTSIGPTGTSGPN